MSHFWHKPLNLVASAAVVLGMIGFSAGAASAQTTHARSAASGSLVFSDYEGPTTANPMTLSVVIELGMANNTLPFGQGPFYNGNVKLQPGFLTKLPPGLHSARQYTAVLRKGLKWGCNCHANKTPITVQDLVFGWHVYTNAGYCVGTCDAISKVVIPKKKGKPSKTTVTFDLNHSDPIFLQYAFPPFIDHTWAKLGNSSQLKACLAKAAGCGPVVANLTASGAGALNYQNSSYVTAGPYRVNAWATNDTRVTFKPNPLWSNSWIGEKAAHTHLKNLIFQEYAPEDPGLINAAATNATDVTQDLTVKQLGHLKQHQGKHYKIINTATFNPEEMFFNDGFKNVKVVGLAQHVDYNGPNPVYNKNVRLALTMSYNHANALAYAYSVDKSTAKSLVSYTNPVPGDTSKPDPYADTKVIKGVWDPIGGKTKKGAYIIPGSSRAIADARKLIEKATKHGKCDGSHTCINPLFITTNATDNPARNAFVTFFHSAWAKIGVSVHLEDVSNSAGGTYLLSYSQNGIAAHSEFMVAIFAYGLGIPQPDSLRTALVGSFCPSKDPSVKKRDTDGNDSCINDGTINKAWKSAESTGSDAIRRKDFNTIQVAMSKNAYWNFLDVRPNVGTVDKKAGGVIGNPFDSDAANWNPWDWYAKF